MNVSAINRGFVDRFERNAPFDFYVFYPNYVTQYDYQRDVNGHIADIDNSKNLTHSAIREFVRRVMVDSELANSLNAAYSKHLPNKKAYDFNGGKIVVRHLRGDWSTVSSTQDVHVYYNNPLFGTTATDLPHNMYTCWVGGYQRDRIYYGDLLVPVARKGGGPIVRNESLLPVQVIRGISIPSRINASMLLLEDWMETRTEYDADTWSTEESPEGETDSNGYYTIDGETDPGKYRLTYTDEAGETQTIYFELNEDGTGLISMNPVPDYVTEPMIQEYRECEDHYNYDAF